MSSPHADRSPNDRFRALVEHSCDWIWEVDETGAYTYSSPQIETILGYKPSDVLGKTAFDLMPLEEARRVTEAFTSALKTGTPIQALENINLHADGHEVVLETSGVPILDETGAVIGYRGVDRDITQRKQAEEKAQRAETMFRTIYNSASEALMMLDQDGFFDCNETVLKLFGVPSVEAFRKLHPADLSPPLQEDGSCSLTAANERIARAMREGSDSFEWLHKRLDTEEIFPAEVILTAMTLDGRQVLHASVRDITERKQREHEQREVEEQLQQTQRLESLGVLAGGIAHDFNNILMAIMGHAELALDELSPLSPGREHLAGITDAAKRAADLCGQMLAYSGKGRLETQSIALTKLIEEVQHMLKISISKKCALQLALGKELPAIRGDATQVRQVLMNLVINASEATEANGGTIRLAAGVMDYAGPDATNGSVIEAGTPGTCVYIEVADSGHGIAAEDLQRIFDPFFTTKFTGRGLGLSAVLGIVRAHRGALVVRSQPGEGTTFRVLFPATDGPAQAKPPAERQTDWRGNGTVLLVDDEEGVRTVSGKLLGRLGFDVVTAADGGEALERYRQQQDEIDLVLLDLTMPKMGGEEAYRELRKVNPEVQIVLASGYSESDVASRFSDQGLAGCLQKPYTLQNLRDLLAELL